MQISREEFKNLYNLYCGANAYAEAYSEFYDDEKMWNLYAPVFEYIQDCLGIGDVGWDTSNLFMSLYYDKCVPIKWTMEQVGEDEWETRDIVHSSDLDEIYDAYLVQKEEE